MNDAILTDLQADLVARLLADEVLGALPVLDERKTDLVSDIDQALGVITAKGGKAGACLVVLSPIADDDNPDAPGGPLEVKISIAVYENVLMNTGADGFGLAALTLARRVHRCLKHYVAKHLCQNLVADRPCIVPVDSPLAPVTYEVRFRTVEADPGVYYKALAPTISGTTAAVSLACGTSGAAIYYTTDGSHPRSGNATATRYTVPFTVTAGKTVRAGAYKTNYLASDINAQLF